MRPARAAAPCVPSALLAVALLVSVGGMSGSPHAVPALSERLSVHGPELANDSVVGNFSDALGRIVALLGVAGGALLSVVWARVALSWFSNDVSKKVQAKDRARDALVGTLLFTAALTGLLWGLARWVLTGA